MWWIVFHSAQKLRCYALVGNKQKKYNIVRSKMVIHQPHKHEELLELKKSHWGCCGKGGGDRGNWASSWSCLNKRDFIELWVGSRIQRQISLNCPFIFVSLISPLAFVPKIYVFVITLLSPRLPQNEQEKFTPYCRWFFVFDYSSHVLDRLDCRWNL